MATGQIFLTDEARIKDEAKTRINRLIKDTTDLKGLYVANNRAYFDGIIAMLKERLRDLE